MRVALALSLAAACLALVSLVSALRSEPHCRREGIVIAHALYLGGGCVRPRAGS